MAVSENDLVVGPLTPAAGVTTISLDFDGTGWEAGWLEVYKSGSETPLVLNTDYTVAGAGSSSGVVTLTTAANGTDAYSIYLAVPLERSSDMQLRGEFKSGPFNIEMDRLWQAMQRRATLASRALQISRSASANTVLTPTASRLIGWDSNGDLTNYSISPVFTAGEKVLYSSVAALLAGSEAQRGVGSIWHGGVHSYQEVASGGDVQNAAAAPALLKILRDSGGVYNFEAFAPSTDGTNAATNSDKFADAFARMQDGGGGVLRLPAGHYAIDEALDPPTDVPVIIEGDGYVSQFDTTSSKGTKIEQKTSAAHAIDLNRSVNTYHQFGLRNLAIEGGGVADAGIDAARTRDVYISGVRFFNFTGNAIQANRNCFNWRCDGVQVDKVQRALYCYDSLATGTDYACFNGSSFENFFIVNTAEEAFWLERTGYVDMSSILWEVDSATGDQIGGGVLKECHIVNLNNMKAERCSRTTLVIEDCTQVELFGLRMNVEALTAGPEYCLHIKNSERVKAYGVQGRYVDAVVKLEGAKRCLISGAAPVAEDTTHIGYLIDSDSTSEENVFIGAIADGVKSAGIRIQGARNKLSSSILTGTREGPGVLLDGATAIDNTLTDVDANDNCTQATTNGDAGIYINNGDKNKLIGCRTNDGQGTKTQPYGVKTAGGANDNKIHLHTAVGNLTGPFSLANSRDEVIMPRTSDSSPHKGTFTMAAGTSLTVSNGNIHSGSVVLLTPTNYHAADLQGSTKSLYVTNLVAGTSFQVKTADNTAAVGDEEFSYIIM